MGKKRRRREAVAVRGKDPPISRTMLKHDLGGSLKVPIRLMI
jgi:hypothetical protein